MNAKQESEKLMNAVLPVAKQMLKQHGEFYPYGGYTKQDGTIVHVGAKDGETDRPKSEDLIHILQNAFRELATCNEIRAAALVFNVSVNLPKSARKSDAIHVYIDHVEGYSVEVFFSYQIVNSNDVYGETFAQAGKPNIFGAS